MKLCIRHIRAGQIKRGDLYSDKDGLHLVSSVKYDLVRTSCVSSGKITLEIEAETDSEYIELEDKIKVKVYRRLEV